MFYLQTFNRLHLLLTKLLTDVRIAHMKTVPMGIILTQISASVSRMRLLSYHAVPRVLHYSVIGTSSWIKTHAGVFALLLSQQIMMKMRLKIPRLKIPRPKIPRLKIPRLKIPRLKILPLPGRLELGALVQGGLVQGGLVLEGPVLVLGGLELGGLVQGGLVQGGLELGAVTLAAAVAAAVAAIDVKKGVLLALVIKM